MSPPQPITPGYPKLSVALIVPDDEQRRAVGKAFFGTQTRIVRELNEYPDEHGISKLIDAGCDVVVVGLDGGVEAGLTAVEAICQRDTSITVVTCASVNDADVVIRAMRAGAREFLTAPLTPISISEALSRASARRHAAGRERVTGKVVVFHGAKGGTGVTMLATNFAVALTKESCGKVVLVDLHPQLGEVALSLGVTARFAIADALANAARLDADFLSSLLSWHESGLALLASPEEHAAQRSLDRGSEKLFRLLTEEFAFVVVDAGPCSGNTHEALFEFADTVFLVTEMNLPALRNARRMISWHAARKSGAGLEVVVNRYNSRMVEIDEESSIKALTRRVDWKIPNDYMAVRGAQNLGVPLVTRDTPISRVVIKMAKATAASKSVDSGRTVETARSEKWKFWTSNNIRPLSIARS
jgi:pilus assembly protein CpaE